MARPPSRLPSLARGRPDRPAGVGRAAVLIAALLGWMLALAAPAHAQTAASGARVELREAFAVTADTPRFPADLPVQRVALPDDWSASRPGLVGPVWYRVGFDARGVEQSGELFALYVERVRSRCSSTAAGSTSPAASTGR
jgi:hypothetical protein